MRITLLCLLLLPLISLSQKTFVSGKLSAASDETVQLVIDKNFLAFQPAVHAAKTKDGNFIISFDLDRDRIGTVLFQNRSLQLYMQPGDSIVISGEASQFPASLEFSGKGGANNNFLHELSQKFPEPDSESAWSLIQTSSVDEFEAKIYSMRKQRMDFYASFPGKEKFSAAFKIFFENQVRYFYYARLLDFAMQKDQSNDGLKINPLPSIMLESISKVQLNNEVMLIDAAYRSFLLNRIAYLTAEMNGFQPFENHSVFLEKKYNVALKELSGNVFRFALARNLSDFCSVAEPATVKKLLTALSQTDAEGIFVKPVQQKCAEQITAKEPKKEKESEPDTKKEKEKKEESASKPAPFEMVDMEGKPVSLDDFKGKVLYVDFWASWCGPCRQQFPHSKELHKMLNKQQQKKVVFLYISIDNSEEAWKGAIQKFEIEGFNALSPGGWGSGAARYFQVSSIPRYMLIDKKGNIADPNAKRPSSREAILQDILKLLE